MLKAVQRHSLKREVEEIIRAYIGDSGLREHDRLPPERELAEALQVSRTVVREALSSLEAQEIVEIRPGSGVVVRNALPAQTATPSPMGEELQDTPSPALQDFLYSLYIGFADLTCCRASEAQVRELAAQVDRMEEMLGEGKTILLEVNRFFWTLVEITGNDLFTELRPLYDEVNRRGLLSEPGILRQPSLRAREHLRNHRTMVEALRYGDAQMLEGALRREFNRDVHDPDTT